MADDFDKTIDEGFFESFLELIDDSRIFHMQWILRHLTYLADCHGKFYESFSKIMAREDLTKDEKVASVLSYLDGNRMAKDVLDRVAEAVPYVKRWALLASFIVYVFKGYLDPEGMPHHVYEMAKFALHILNHEMHRGVYDIEVEMEAYPSPPGMPTYLDWFASSWRLAGDKLRMFAIKLRGGCGQPDSKVYKMNSVLYWSVWVLTAAFLPGLGTTFSMDTLTPATVSFSFPPAIWILCGRVFRNVDIMGNNLSTGCLKPLQDISQHVAVVSNILDGVEYNQLTRDHLLELQDSIHNIDKVVKNREFHKDLEEVEETVVSFRDTLNNCWAASITKLENYDWDLGEDLFK